MLAPCTAANRHPPPRRQPGTRRQLPPQARRGQPTSRTPRTTPPQTPRRQRPHRTHRRPRRQPDRDQRQMRRPRRPRQPQQSQPQMRRTPRRQRPNRQRRRTRRVRTAPATIKALLTLRLRPEMPRRSHPRRPPVQRRLSQPPSSRMLTLQLRRLQRMDRRQPQRLAHKYGRGLACRGRTTRLPMPRNPVSRLRSVSQAINRTRMPRLRARMLSRHSRLLRPMPPPTRPRPAMHRHNKRRRPRQHRRATPPLRRPLTSSRRISRRPQQVGRMRFRRMRRPQPIPSRPRPRICRLSASWRQTWRRRRP